MKIEKLIQGSKEINFTESNKGLNLRKRVRCSIAQLCSRDTDPASSDLFVVEFESFVDLLFIFEENEGEARDLAIFDLHDYILLLEIV